VLLVRINNEKFLATLLAAIGGDGGYRRFNGVVVGDVLRGAIGIR
jgi:hypothetical protein